jgi:hypothetical protein
VGFLPRSIMDDLTTRLTELNKNIQTLLERL